MTTPETIKFLENYNRWRRGADIPQPDPKELGKAIDHAIMVMKAAMVTNEYLSRNGFQPCKHNRHDLPEPEM
jgi:hypothetical protein